MATDNRLVELNTGALPSNRSFGALFVAVFLLIALWPCIFGRPARLWAFPVSAAFALVTVVIPRWLTPLNWAWMELAEILHRIMSPVILGAMFYLVIVPFGLTMRLFHRDELKLRLDQKVESYWEDRKGYRLDFSSFKRQF